MVDRECVLVDITSMVDSGIDHLAESERGWCQILLVDSELVIKGAVELLAFEIENISAVDRHFDRAPLQWCAGFHLFGNIECQNCRDTFKKQVLDYKPGAEALAVEAEFKTAVRHVMALMTLADGEVDDAEIEDMVRINEKVSGEAMTAEAMRAEVEATKRDAKPLAEYLKGVTPYVNPKSKELIVKAALLIAAADGAFHEAERELIGEIGKALDLTPAHLNGIMSEMEGA